jgi:predicted DNA-binding transcriptional regulator AlpA
MVCTDQIYGALHHIELLLEKLFDTIIHFITEQQQKPLNPTSELWLNANQVRELLQMSESTYHRRINAGLLVGKFEGGRRLFSQEEIDKYMQEEQSRKWNRS